MGRIVLSLKGSLKRKNRMEHIQNDGQIKYDDTMGKLIAQYAQDTRFTNYLEIGTWNGGGSTYCFAKGFEDRKTPFYFGTLEINKERYNEAKEKYKNVPYVHLYNGSILSIKELPDINTFFKLFDVNTNWIKEDFYNLRSSSTIEFKYKVPEVVLLDGSEYLTYFEFKKLYDTTKVFILDDINTEKCRKIVEELENSNEWNCVNCVRNERNGWATFERK
jgi:hypothetical protein